MQSSSLHVESSQLSARRRTDNRLDARPASPHQSLHTQARLQEPPRLQLEPSSRSEECHGSEVLPVVQDQVGREALPPLPRAALSRTRAQQGTIVIMLHKTTWEIEPATENHTEFMLFNKILQTQINFPHPVFIVSSISREATGAMIDRRFPCFHIASL